MDSINIMTSLMGLLGSAGQIVALLLVVKQSLSQAPRFMDQVFSQVRELEYLLSAVQSFLLGISSAPRRRISMIRLDQLLATLSEAVLTFSELEVLVESIAKDRGKLPIMSRLMSLWKEEDVTSIMLRLERHKSSLSLMLNIAQCESDLEAEQSQATLQGLIKELLRSNQQISSRLQNIEDSLETGSILTNCFRNGNLDESAEDSDPEDLYRVEPDRNIRRNLSEDSSQPGFHDDLGTSRVYRRTERYESDISFTSSAIRTHAWSIFSGLSLSEVSVISAIALPLFLEEISNRQWYTFERLDNASPNPLRQVMSESFRPASRSVYATTIEQVAQMVEPRGLGGVSSLLNPPTSSGGSPASSSAQASTSRAVGSQRVINQQELVFRDPNLTSLDGSPSLESRESSAPSPGDARTERPSTSASEKSRLSLRSISNLWDARTVRPNSSAPTVSRQTVYTPALKKHNLPLYKLVVLGDGGVGKTELTIEFTSQHFVKTYDPTFGDSYRKKVVIDRETCWVEILDTAGQEEYTALRDQWVRDGEGFVIIYSVGSRSSFTRTQRFYNQIERLKVASLPSSAPHPLSKPALYTYPVHVPIMLVGNNCEMTTEREVSTEEGHALARAFGCEFLEVSTKNSINVEKTFYDVVRMIRKQRSRAATP